MASRTQVPLELAARCSRVRKHIHRSTATSLWPTRSLSGDSVNGEGIPFESDSRITRRSPKDSYEYYNWELRYPTGPLHDNEPVSRREKTVLNSCRVYVVNQPLYPDGASGSPTVHFMRASKQDRKDYAEEEVPAPGSSKGRPIRKFTGDSWDDLKKAVAGLRAPAGTRLPGWCGVAARRLRFALWRKGIFRHTDGVCFT